MDPREQLSRSLHSASAVLENPERRRLIADALERREAIPLATGALATWTPPESTGRSPKDTYIVRRPENEGTIDWSSPNCIPMDPETFDLLWADACRVLAAKDRVYVCDRVVGADPAYALPVRTVTPRALTALFSWTMFRPVPEDIGRSAFADRPFLLLSLPYDKVDASRYEGRLRTLPDGRTSDMAIVMDFERRLGLVYGSAYCGTNKKLMFTVMNYLLPEVGVLPLHCSANEGKAGDCALLLGLSGTGKTTLSADPDRALLGDDEHGWSDNGIANFEYGCYAKLINLRQDKEPEIWHATFHEADPLDHGAIVENLMVYPDGTFDVDDERLTPNSRAAYPLSFLTNIKDPPVSGHPTTILFLTADANGVLPPVARLDKNRAMFWFLMGYTSKLAGTETGVVDPVSTFSRFFGAPFMPRNPGDYARMLGEKLDRHGTRVFLVNTGWSGGPYGVGRRMDIALTRAVVNAALSGALDEVPYQEDPLFHLAVPTACPGVPPEVLVPKNTWADPAAYEARARKLAEDFRNHFEKAYGDKAIDPAVAAQCPGR
ncbi:MAG: phosphoenolpyruvate carboxykinase (ATP) [Candidatus Dadabacteria bacterium]|nr:MAG: phosphoenolpyruvate carboxykinase (ATP) [Candidatus Dadabacteria bacterium]